MAHSNKEQLSISADNASKNTSIMFLTVQYCEQLHLPKTKVGLLSPTETQRVYQASSATLGWPGSDDCHTIQERQLVKSGGCPYPYTHTLVIGENYSKCQVNKEWSRVTRTRNTLRPEWITFWDTLLNEPYNETQHLQNFQNFNDILT